MAIPFCCPKGCVLRVKSLDSQVPSEKPHALWPLRVSSAKAAEKGGHQAQGDPSQPSYQLPKTGQAPSKETHKEDSIDTEIPSPLCSGGELVAPPC